MANVEGDTAIQWINRAFVIATGKLFDVHTRNGAVFQFQNVRLNVMQQVVWRHIDKSVQLLAALQVRKEINVVAPKLPPGARHGVAAILSTTPFKERAAIFAFANCRQSGIEERTGRE